MAYATTAQLKEELGITGSAQDTYLSAVLDRVSAWIDTQTNRKFQSQDTTVSDELYERQGCIIWLKQVGVSDVTTVKVRQLRSDDWTTLDASTYEWTSQGRLSLPLSYRFVQVTYAYGSSVPKDIEQACLQLAAEVYRASRQDTTGDIASERIGDYQVTYRSIATAANSAASNVMSTLRAYRLRAV